MIKCIDCGLDYSKVSMSLNLPREQWLMINPEDGGVLCANCMIERASKLSNVINITGKITFAKDY